ncbi:MAG: hypothetical protein SFU20_04880 [Chitinophagaceae bacterium]|nr:hypothetical protein [Chitinophagaceae bacterium]
MKKNKIDIWVCLFILSSAIFYSCTNPKDQIESRVNKTFHKGEMEFSKMINYFDTLSSLGIINISSFSRHEKKVIFKDNREVLVSDTSRAIPEMYEPMLEKSFEFMSRNNVTVTTLGNDNSVVFQLDENGILGKYDIFICYNENSSPTFQEYSIDSLLLSNDKNWASKLKDKWYLIAIKKSI